MKVDKVRFKRFFLSKKRLFVVSVTILSSLAVCPATGAAIYRCKGEAGEIEFRQMPCEEGDGGVVEVDVRTTEWVDSRGDHSSISVSSGNRKKRKRKTTPPVSMAADDDRQSKVCWRVKSQIKRIEWKLRKGYKPAQGERLRRQRREKEAYFRKFCK